MISTIDLTRNTTDRFFIDSNILVYSYDSADPDKRSVAQQLIADLVGNRNGFISVQVLGEFFVSVTRRIRNPLSIEEAGAAVDLLGSLPVIDIDTAMVRRAIATHSRYGTNLLGLPDNRRRGEVRLHQNSVRRYEHRPVLPRHTCRQSLSGLKLRLKTCGKALARLTADDAALTHVGDLVGGETMFGEDFVVVLSQQGRRAAD